MPRQPVARTAGGQVGGMRIHVPHAVAHRAGLAVRAVAPAPVLAIAAALGGAREAAPEFQDRAERRCAVRIGHQGRAGDQIRRRQAGNVGAVRYSVRYVDALHFAFSSKIFTLPRFVLDYIGVVSYYRDMSKTPISKSQKRAMELLGLASVDGYSEAASALEAAGCYRDGIPAGQTWRTAAKLSDADLVAGIRKSDEGFGMSAVNIAEYGY